MKFLIMWIEEGIIIINKWNYFRINVYKDGVGLVEIILKILLIIF